MTFYKLVDGVVYYKLAFGKLMNEDTRLVSNNYIYIRFSDLYNLQLYHEQFPPRTLFRYTSPTFIQQRLNRFKDWFDYVLRDKNKSKALFIALSKLENKVIV